jgi:Clp protease
MLTMQHRGSCQVGRVLAATLLGAGITVHSMEFKRHQEWLMLSGPVVSDDKARLRDAIAAGGVRTIVLHNSPGGDLNNGMWLGQMVREQGWNTVLAGYCASACALIFVGGVERRFSTRYDFRNSAIGIHGPHDRETGQMRHDLSPLLRNHILSMTANRFDGALLHEALNGAYARDILNIRKPRRLGTPSTPVSVFACAFGAAGDQKDCKPVPGHDVMSLGVITHEEPATLPPELF